MGTSYFLPLAHYTRPHFLLPVPSNHQPASVSIHFDYPSYDLYVVAHACVPRHKLSLVSKEEKNPHHVIRLPSL